MISVGVPTVVSVETAARDLLAQAGGDEEKIPDLEGKGLFVTPDSIDMKVRELAKTNCAVIYLTEQLAKDMDDVLARYKDELRPAIILIPGREGSLGIGKNNIQRAIERAVGADIL